MNNNMSLLTRSLLSLVEETKVQKKDASEGTMDGLLGGRGQGVSSDSFSSFAATRDYQGLKLLQPGHSFRRLLSMD